MNWMSRKVGVVNDERKKAVCHTVKNCKIEQRVRKSFMSNVNQNKFGPEVINLQTVPGFKEKGKTEKEENKIDKQFENLFNEEEILRNYQRKKFLNFN